MLLLDLVKNLFHLMVNRFLFFSFENLNRVNIWTASFLKIYDFDISIKYIFRMASMVKVSYKISEWFVRRLNTASYSEPSVNQPGTLTSATHKLLRTTNNQAQFLPRNISRV